MTNTHVGQRLVDHIGAHQRARLSLADGLLEIAAGRHGSERRLTSPILPALFHQWEEVKGSVGVDPPTDSAPVRSAASAAFVVAAGVGVD